jgi:hypothetical protein
MTRPVAFLKWCGGLAFLAIACASTATPASADSVFFGYSSGHHYYRPGPAYYHHHPHWGPRYGGEVVFVNPPPVYVPAPPPPTVVYAPSAPINATPTSDPYRTSDGRYCREYQSQVTVNGALQPSYGTACQQPDGSWRVEN